MKEPDKEWFDEVSSWANKSAVTFGENVEDGTTYVITVNKMEDNE